MSLKDRKSELKELKKFTHLGIMIIYKNIVDYLKTLPDDFDKEKFSIYSNICDLLASSIVGKFTGNDYSYLWSLYHLIDDTIIVDNKEFPIKEMMGSIRLSLRLIYQKKITKELYSILEYINMNYETKTNFDTKYKKSIINHLNDLIKMINVKQYNLSVVDNIYDIYDNYVLLCKKNNISDKEYLGKAMLLKHLADDLLYFNEIG